MKVIYGRKLICLCILVVTCQTVYLQGSYFNKALPVGDYFTIPHEFVYVTDDSILVQSQINFDNVISGALIKYFPLLDSVAYYFKHGTGFSDDGLIVDDDGTLVGIARKTDVNPRYDFYLRIDGQGETLESIPFQIGDQLPSGYINMLRQGDFFYGMAVMTSYDADGNQHRELQMSKFNMTGEVVWSKVYGQELKLTWCWEMEEALDGNIFISIKKVEYDSIFAYTNLVKIDSDTGDVIWESQAWEPRNDGASATPIAVLSNGNIVQAYKVNKWNLISLPINYEPMKLIWYNSEGTIFKDSIFFLQQPLDIQFSTIIPSKGGFFLLGGYTTMDYRYAGVILKMRNDGLPLWQKHYLHPSVAATKKDCYLLDLVEMDNGDLVVYGAVDYEIPWILRLDSNGCLGFDDCGELVVDTEEAYEPSDKVALYPNPVSDLLTIYQTKEILTTYILTDDTGKVVDMFENSRGDMSLLHDVSDYPDGLYHLLVTQKGKTTVTQQFVVCH